MSGAHLVDLARSTMKFCKSLFAATATMKCNAGNGSVKWVERAVMNTEEASKEQNARLLDFSPIRAGQFFSGESTFASGG
jgi:hypothetical protein